MHESSEFVTLTYQEDKLPYGRNLQYRDFQLFMKKLRNKKKEKIRFYMCGEYGPRRDRPHYHAILFGVFFEDRKAWKLSKAGSPIYISKELDELWGKGMCTTGAVNFESAGYVARYVMKKMNGKRAAEAYETLVPETGEVIMRTPEFNKMSLKPGIGRSWLEKWKTDCYPRDEIVLNGKKMKPPKYYDKIYAEMDSEAKERQDYERYKRGIEHSGDATEERLRVRETVVKARMALNRRELE
jgi:hypothetical protein